MTLLTIPEQKMDDIDLKVINFLMAGKSSKEISATIKIPLSTVQRRIRLIQESGIIKSNLQLDYQKFGLKKGLLHVYLHDGDFRAAADKLSNIDGVTSASVHLGNSDVVLEFVFTDTTEVLDLISAVKKLEGIDRVLWSQEVYSVSKPLVLVTKNGKVDSSMKKRRPAETP